MEVKREAAVTLAEIDYFEGDVREVLRSLKDEPTPLGRRVNSVFLGTNVISGFATAVVVGTGPETEFGKISERLEQKQPETGFERGLRNFGKLLVKLVLIITLIIRPSGLLGPKSIDKV